MYLCNECRLTCVVVLVVMLTGYLPEMQNKHLMKSIMMIGQLFVRISRQIAQLICLTILIIQPVELI